MRPRAGHDRADGERRWRSLTTRLTVLATSVTALVLLLVLTAVLLVFSRQLNGSVDDALLLRSQALEDAIAEDGVEEITHDRIAELYQGSQVVGASATLRGDRPLLTGTGRLSCPGAPRYSGITVPFGATGEARPLRILQRCLPDDRMLAVATEVEGQREAAERLLVLLAVALPVLLALVAATVGRALRAALRPVGDLTRAAALISHGSAGSGKLPTVPGHDEIALLASTLQDMLTRLDVAFGREQAFVDEASHELRTPLAVLRGELELALSDLTDHEGVEQSLRAAHQEATRLSRLAEDLLLAARERARPAMSAASPAARVDVAAWLGGNAERLPLATGLTIEVECPVGLVVRADPDRLDRVLANLLSNAASAGARHVRITVAPAAGAGSTAQAGGLLQQAGGGVLVTVEDDGPGFPEQFLPSAFERFSRADTARSRSSGSGLGLALVRDMLQELGGAVTAANGGALGGAVLRLWFPAAP